jgi:hypothetical protein
VYTTIVSFINVRDSVGHRLSGKQLKVLEDGFVSNVAADRIPAYQSLQDTSLSNFYESRKVQRHLLQMGLIDHEGHVIDLDKHKAKLNIIEQEFVKAEKEEALQASEEREMRKRVQKKRHDALELARVQRRMAQMKEDNAIQQQISAAALEAFTVSKVMKRKKKKKPKQR